MAPLEELPLLILERICEYVDNDDLEGRSGLWAFSLASVSLCIAAEPRRFCQLVLQTDGEDLEKDLNHFSEMLGLRHRHVRRLKVSLDKAEILQKPDVTKKYEEPGRNQDSSYFDIHPFCQPSKTDSTLGTPALLVPEKWMLLCTLISHLPGLQDLVWTYGGHMPQILLSAISTNGCRLHMHNFQLHSLIQQPGNPQPIGSDDYALITTPSLCSIVFRTGVSDGMGNLDYNEEAVKILVAGMAPNLTHLGIRYSIFGSGLDQDDSVSIERPVLSDLFPPTSEPDRVTKLGSLRSLVSVDCDSVNGWATVTDFSKLCSLRISWSLRSGTALAEIAMRGKLRSLHTLELSLIEDDTDGTDEALYQILGNLAPLHHLNLDGYITVKTFDTIIHHHGNGLRSLKLYPYQHTRDDESQTLLVSFSAPVVNQISERCVNLERLWLPIIRTRGDSQETAIYKALGRMLRLRHLGLLLNYWVGPDEDLWNKDRDGYYPLFDDYITSKNLAPVYLREVFINSAIDATLARSIFAMISSTCTLRTLELETRQKFGYYSGINEGYGGLHCLWRWLNRSWVCKRGHGDLSPVTVQEFDVKATADVGNSWQRLAEEELSDDEESFVQVFKDIWPAKTEQWWKDWESLPLSDEVN